MIGTASPLKELVVGETFQFVIRDEVFLKEFQGSFVELDRFIQLTARAVLVPVGGLYRMNREHDALYCGTVVSIERVK